MKKLITSLIIAAMLLSVAACARQGDAESSSYGASQGESGSTPSSSSEEEPVSEAAVFRELSKADITDKIKGSWAGQMYGVTWGAPTEFRYCGSIIPESEVPDMKTLDINIKIENPFNYKTKSEVIDMIPEKWNNIIQRTMHNMKSRKICRYIFF